MDLLYKRQGQEPLRPAVHLIRCALSSQAVVLLGNACSVTVLCMQQKRGLYMRSPQVDLPSLNVLHAGDRGGSESQPKDKGANHHVHIFQPHHAERV